MIDYGKMRSKFPQKKKKLHGKSAAVKAIAREYELKKAELGLGEPLTRRGFPYYMTIIVGLLIVGGLVGTALKKNGGVDFTGKNKEKAEKSVHALAVALGRYRYHVGKYPTTEEGLEQLSSKNVSARGWNGPYIKKVNQDPWKRDYVYVYNGEGEFPTLYSKGPDGAAGTTDDIIAKRADFDEPFRDTSWTKEWVPMHLRDIVVAQDEKHKRELEEELRQILHPEIPVEGESVLKGTWLFATPDNAEKNEWADVRVPHDWSASTLPGYAGSAVYRKVLTVPQKATGRYIALRFSGVSGSAKVLLNGETLCEKQAGSGCFEVDVTGRIRPGGMDVLEVEVSGDGVDGKGLTGPVYLSIEDPSDRIIAGSLKVETLSLDSSVAKMRISYETPAGGVTNDFDLVEPRIWTCERPFLYKGYLCGRMHYYAVRDRNWRPDPVRGVDVSSGMGLAGMAYNEELARRRLQTVKDLGANAVFFTGSVPLKEQLRLCDEMGLVVSEESFGIEAFDGISTPGEGLCDIGGIPRQKYWELKAGWTQGGESPLVRLFPHWNWGDEGAPVKIACVTGGNEAELFVNGESAGRRGGEGCRPGTPLEWEVPFEQGEVKAIAYSSGRYLGEVVLKTAGKPFRAAISAEKQALCDGETVFVTIRPADGDGNPVPDASGEVSLSLEGPGEIMAIGNPLGAIAFVPGVSAKFNFSSGAAYAIVRRTGGSGIPLVLAASVSGVRPATLSLPRRQE